MSLKKSYHERFLKRLEELTAEELKAIFDKVLDGKNIDKFKNDILINFISEGYKNIDFINPSYKKSNAVIIKSFKGLMGNAYKDSSYKMPKYNMQGIIQKAS